MTSPFNLAAASRNGIRLFTQKLHVQITNNPRSPQSQTDAQWSSASWPPSFFVTSYFYYLRVAGVVLLFNLWVTIRAVAVTHQKQNRNRSQTNSTPREIFPFSNLKKQVFKKLCHEVDHVLLLGRIKEVCCFQFLIWFYFHPQGLRNCYRDGSGWKGCLKNTVDTQRQNQNKNMVYGTLCRSLL